MDNRRPPRSNSSGPGKYYDRSRSGPAASSGTPRNKPDGNRGSSLTASPRPGGPPRGRPGSGPDRPDGRRFNDRPQNSRGRYGAKPQDGRLKKAQNPEPAIKITSDLQVTDGKHAGRLLGNSDSPKAATMPRLVRDAMFRLIARRIRGGRVLDLCAGCGMIGLEAISRGSMLSTFVERSARAATFLRKNIAEMGIKDGHAEVIEMEAGPYLRRSAGRKRTWDVVFLARTGGAGDAELLDLVSRGRVIEPGGLAVIEHSVDQPLPDKLGSLVRWRTLEKDGVSLSFYNRN